MKKALEKRCPGNLNKLFKFLENRCYDLCDNGIMLMLSKPKTNAIAMTSFSYRTAKIRNEQDKDGRMEIVNELNPPNM